MIEKELLKCTKTIEKDGFNLQSGVKVLLVTEALAEAIPAWLAENTDHTSLALRRIEVHDVVALAQRLAVALDLGEGVSWASIGALGQAGCCHLLSLVHGEARGVMTIDEKQIVSLILDIA